MSPRRRRAHVRVEQLGRSRTRTQLLSEFRLQRQFHGRLERFHADYVVGAAVGCQQSSVGSVVHH